MQNVRIRDNGAAFLVEVDGLTVQAFGTIGDAWRHIKWMHEIASQRFTVGKNRVPVEEWIELMTRCWCVDF